MDSTELQEFLAESRDLISQAESSLIRLETNASFATEYDAVFRAFHTIKGMAGMLEQFDLQKHVHQIETLLTTIKGVDTVPRAYIDFFLRACDATTRLLNGETVEFNYTVEGEPLHSATAPGDGHASAVSAEALEKGGEVLASDAVAARAAAPLLQPEVAQNKVEIVQLEIPTQALSFAAGVVPEVRDSPELAWKTVEQLAKASIEASVGTPRKAMDADALEFLAESEDSLQNLYEAITLIYQGKATDVAFVNSVYRDIHSVKGGSQLFGFAELATLTHALENILDTIRKQKRPFSKTEIESLLTSTSAVQQLIGSLREMPKNVLAPAPASRASHLKEHETNAAPQPHPAKSADTNKPSVEVADTSVRVPVALLDKLMASMGEMVLVRNQVLQYANRSDDFEFLRMSQRLDIVTSEIQGEVMKTRMQPIGVVLSKFQRIVRDLSNTLHKRIDLILMGTETELDKTLLEAVKDPLMHIVRNSCDHGLEPTEERRAAGKTDAGKILIKSFQEGGQVVIEVSDDGRGLNRDKLLKKAIEKGLVTADRGFSMSNRDVYNLIFAAGFSTAAEITNVSGRGVGMDVVRSNIEKIGGLVDLESRPKLGMTIRLKIPLTLAILPAMIIRSGDELYAIPQVKVVELVRIEPSDAAASRIDMLQGKPIYRLRGTLLPLLSIKKILGLPHEDPRALLAQSLPLNIVVVRAEKQMFGVIVDEVQEKADIVIKPLSSFLKSVSAYGGATVLGDGAIALILDIVGVAQLHGLGLNENSYTESSEELERARRARLEAQEFLLFRVAERRERHAIPMSLVHRLEEKDVSDIEQSGNQSVVRYRDGILPILSLGKRLGYASSDITEGEIFRLVVVKKSNRLFGFRVAEILDVLATLDQMDDSPTDNPLLLGNLVAKDGVVVVVDVLRVIEEYVKTLAAPPALLDFSQKDERIRLLFAEDTTFFRKHVKSVLEKAGFRIDLAINGVEAVDMLKRAPAGTYKALLSDIEMPEMDGLTLVRTLRAMPEIGNIPAVALTTRFSPENIAEGKAAGFDEYMEKMNAEKLIGSLSNLLKLPTDQLPAHSRGS